VNLLQSLPEAELTVIPPSFRIRRGSDLEDVGAVLAYGDNETVEEISCLAGAVPVRGFGGRVGLSVLEADDFNQQIPGLVRDVLSLGQRGCMATRMLIIHDQGGLLEPYDMAADLETQMRLFWQNDPALETVVALDCEAFRLKKLGFKRCQQPERGWPLVAVKVIEKEGDIEEIDPSFAAQVPMTLPVIIVRGRTRPKFRESLCEVLQKFPSLASISVAPPAFGEVSLISDNNHYFRSLGSANAPLWDGTHEGFPLFLGPVVS
jgi:hypothetical protein